MLRWKAACVVLAGLTMVAGDLRADDAARLPAPDKSAVGTASDELLKHFEIEARDKSEAGRTLLADTLLGYVDRNQGDEVSRYAACDQVYEIAVELGYPILMARAVEKLSRLYEVDDSQWLTRGYERMLADTHPSAIYRDLAREVLAHARRAAFAGEYRQAKRLTELAVTAAGKAKSKQTQRSAETADAAMAACCHMSAEFQEAQSTLKENPDDQAANLAAGAFYCFVKEDWGDGLPLLAKGSDAVLAGLANRSLDGNATYTDRLRTADQWWRIAADSAQPRKDAIEAYAIGIYFDVVPQLKGHEPDRVVVLLRNWIAQHPSHPIVTVIMASANSPPPEVASAPAAAAPSSPAPKSSATSNKPGSVSKLSDFPPLDAALANTIRRAIADRKTTDTKRTGTAGTVVRDVPPEGALLIGIVLHWDDSFTRAIGVEPVYQSSTGAHYGTVLGQRSEKKGMSLARIGYALGGIISPAGSVIEGTDVVMCRVDGLRLNPADRHAFGTRSGNRNAEPKTTIALDGSLVVGLSVTVDSVGKLSGFGLVTLR